MTCDHQTTKTTWVEADDWETEPYWHTETVRTTEDIDVGRFRCTQCGEVMYYTGLWKSYFEEGKPCTGSELYTKNTKTGKLEYTGYKGKKK